MTKEQIFIDTNVLLYYFEPELKQHTLAKNIIESILKNEELGLINSYILNEFHYNISKIYNKSFASKSLSMLFKLPSLEYKDIEFTKKDIIEVAKISAKHNLKTFDAYHAYYCKKEKIKQIATFDSDFKNTPWLKIYQSSLGERDV